MKKKKSNGKPSREASSRTDDNKVMNSFFRTGVVALVLPPLPSNEAENQTDPCITSRRQAFYVFLATLRNIYVYVVISILKESSSFLRYRFVVVHRINQFHYSEACDILFWKFYYLFWNVLQIEIFLFFSIFFRIYMIKYRLKIFIIFL